VRANAIVLAGVLGMLAMALAGCSEPPRKEIDEARAAIDAAQAAGAATYASEEYGGAVSTLEKARASVDQRDYRQALNYALDARQRALEAARLVPDARAQSMAAADAEVQKTADSIVHLESVLRNARVAGASAQQLRASQETLQASRRVLQEARTSVAARKYAEANVLLRGVREKLDTAAQAAASIPPRTTGKRRPG